MEQDHSGSVPADVLDANNGFFEGVANDLLQRHNPVGRGEAGNT